MLRKIGRFCKKKIRRYRNQKHISDYPAECGGWKKYKGNPVLGDKETGTLFDPFIRCVDNRYIMCVSRRRDDCLMFFDSLDGITWENERVILEGIPNSDWETKVNRGCFLIRDNQWYVWYTGQHNGKSRIGLAISRDGRSFSRISSMPVLIPEKDFEGDAVMNPCVLWDADKASFRMWYAAGENYEPDVLCYAESKDGVTWDKWPEPVMKADVRKAYQQFKVGACDILKTKKAYVMAYIAYQNLDVARICVATSNDGILKWETLDENPILSPEKKQWDGHAVYKPTILYDHNRQIIRIWYNGRNGHCEKIGLAEKMGSTIL